jgi:dinuclear metal center YbgI/SA1388 family protein
MRLLDRKQRGWASVALDERWLSMNVGDLVRAMETIAPSRFAASWDNVGLLVGDPASPLKSVLLTIDCTIPVLNEARGGKASAVVSYHPPIFAAQKRFLAGSVAHDAARAGIAIHSPHTALDVAIGGTNDVLADAIAMTSRVPLRPLEPADATVKLVTFVPAEHLAAVSRAVFDAGAGKIGNYSSCGFRTPGTGTFFGREGTKPAAGAAGKLEECAELRFETVVPLARIGEVVGALRAAHPYEEPAFDLVRLAAPRSVEGMGRVGRIESAPVSAVVEAIKRGLALEQVLVAGLVDRDVSRVAVCAGSGGDLVDDAVAAGAELLLTGELRHHDVLRAIAGGLTVVCTLHSASERAALVALERRLAAELRGVTVSCSRVDREPLVFY